MIAKVEDGQKSITTTRNRSFMRQSTDLSWEVAPTSLDEGQRLLGCHLTIFNNAGPG